MRRRSIRWTNRALLSMVLLLVAFVLCRWSNGNFGTVVPDRVYRAAQLSPKGLLESIHQRRIKTVLNLRGSNPDQAWYRAELETTVEAGAAQIDFPMSSDQWLSIEQARTLLEIIDTCDYPLLIHCEWGAERTGLIAAICGLLRPGSTLEDARREFSAYYLFLPMKDGLVMRGHFDRYERWLSQSRASHSPEVFRSWLLNEYQPGSPSRQHWECNPYPLKVVTRIRARSVSTWGERPCSASVLR